MLRRFALLVIALALFTERAASAHPAPRSTVLVDLRASDVAVELRLPTPELEAALGHAPLAAPPALTPAEHAQLSALVFSRFHASSPDHTPFRVTVGEVAYAVEEPAPVVVVHATLEPAALHSQRSFTLEDEVIGRVVPNHVSWILLRSDVTLATPLTEPSVLGVTGYRHHSVLVNRERPAAGSVLGSLFRAGARHIAGGTDHLLFLLVLLLPAPLLTRREQGRTRFAGAASTREALGRVLRIVTAFTLGHSLTLALGAWGVLRLPSAPVETLIAASILISALHAARPLFSRGEAWLAAGFGLVHGLAFAGALRELALGRGELLTALFGFNLGIEAMQLAVVAVTLPWLLLLARTDAYAPFRVLTAVATGLAALGWILQRGFGLANPIDGIVTTLSAHPLALLAGLAAFTLFTRAGFFEPIRRFSRI